jgi:DNA-binding SARP family transcriptional activator
VALGGLTVVVVLGVATPAVLAAVTAATWPHGSDWHAVDPARLGVLVVAAVAWIAWFNYIIGLIREVVSQIRQRNSPHDSDAPRGPSSTRVWVAGWVAGLVLMVLALFGAPSISAWRTPTVSTTTTSIRTMHRTSTSEVTGHTTVRKRTPPGPVSLPSGSIVGGLFAAGVLSAVAIRQLRRRHTYRYSAPEPGRDLSSEPSHPTLRHLRERLSSGGEASESSEAELVAAALLAEVDGRLHPEQADIGTRHGRTVTVDLTALSGLALVGPATDDIARSLIASLLVRAGFGAAEVVLTAELAERLFADLEAVLAIRRAQSNDDVARAVEAEIIARVRRFEAADVSDANSYRSENPEDPLPALLVVLDSVPEEAFGRWRALLDGMSRLGITVLFLEACPIVTGYVKSDLNREVTEVSPGRLVELLDGVQLFGLQSFEAVELLEAVFETQYDERPDQVNEVENEEGERNESALLLLPAGQGSQAVDPVEPVGERWPAELFAGDIVAGPLHVQVLGHYVISLNGEPIQSRLRSRGKALLAWYMLRPEGATSDEAVEALWPDTSPGQVRRQFWRALGELRTRFRPPIGDAIVVLVKTGEHYQPSVSEISCDLWDFQRSLFEAARATDNESVRVALGLAVDSYAGEFLQGWDEPWVESARQDLHRRCVDAFLRLAELEETDGEPKRAVTTLERAIELDHYAEEPYRRLMVLQGSLGQVDTVSATWKLLHTRLEELDLEVEEATTRLYRSLISLG